MCHLITEEICLRPKNLRYISRRPSLFTHFLQLLLVALLAQAHMCFTVDKHHKKCSSFHFSFPQILRMVLLRGSLKMFEKLPIIRLSMI